MIGLDLGVCYESAAILSDDPPPVSTHPITEYIPSTTLGARLPHCWLEKSGERLSTLDRVPSNRFLVLTFEEAGQELSAAVEQLRGNGPPVDLIAIYPGGPLTPAGDQFGDLFSPDQVLFVRPDGHIAARVDEERAETTLERVMGLLWGLE